MTSTQNNAMDRGQREVMRRKRPVIADMLDFSAASQKEYREVGLLADEMMPEILVERSEFGRTFKWLELLPMRGNGAFDRLSSLLISRGHAWLSNEMYADLECERGLLQVEEYVFREAGLLVHKHYGRSKNLAEVEKKELQKLLADRFQAAKEGYSRQNREIQHQLDDALSSKLAQCGRMRDLVQRIHAYLRVEHERLDPSAHSITRALDQIVADPVVYAAKEAKEYGEVLGHSLDGLFDILSKELYEKEVNAAERKQCIAVLMHELGSTEEKPVYHIDFMLEQVIEAYKQEIAQAHRETDLSNKLAKSMEERYNDLKCETDRALAAKEEQILQLEAEVIMKAGTILNLEKKVLEEASEKDSIMEDLEKWKKRYDLIERTRRIGYYQGNYNWPNYGSHFRGRNVGNQSCRLLALEEKDHKKRVLRRDTVQRLVVEDPDDNIPLNDSIGSYRPYGNKNFKKGSTSKSECFLPPSRPDSMMTSWSTSIPPPVDDARYMVAVRPYVRRAKIKEQPISKSPANGGGTDDAFAIDQVQARNSSGEVDGRNERANTTPLPPTGH